MNKKWNERTVSDKLLLVVRIIISICVIIFVLLSSSGIWKEASNLTVPLLGVVNVLQSVQEWKEHRKTAIFGFIVAGFCFIVTLAVFLL